MNQKILILSIPVMLAVLLLGGWLFLREPKSAPESQNPPVVKEDLPQNAGNLQPPANVDTSSVDTSNWKTYRNEEYGFELKYQPEVYEVEDGGYISLISFVARDKTLKEQYGDIQVLYGDGGGGSFNESEISKTFRAVNLGGKKVYFDESLESCGVGLGFCPVPGKAFIFSGNRSYSIRRITFQGAEFPPVMEENFVQFLVDFSIL